MKSLCFVLSTLVVFLVTKLGDCYTVIDLLKGQLEEEYSEHDHRQNDEGVQSTWHYTNTKSKSPRIRIQKKKVPAQELDNGCASEYLQPDIAPYMLQHTDIAGL